jgi:hypothetical protein
MTTIKQEETMSIEELESNLKEARRRLADGQTATMTALNQYLKTEGLISSKRDKCPLTGRVTTLYYLVSKCGRMWRLDRDYFPFKLTLGDISIELTDNWREELNWFSQLNFYKN